MKYPILILTIATACAAPRIVERGYSNHGTNYLARFTYDDANYYTPAGLQPHYPATFDMHRELVGGLWPVIAEKVPGVYTEKGCGEDTLESLFYAIANQQGNQAANDVATVGKAIHAAPVTTNLVSPQFPVAQADWQVQLVDTNGVGSFNVQWVSITNTPPTNPGLPDTARHFDTNSIMRSLVATMTWQGVSNIFNLPGSEIITNSVREWHWGKVYTE